MRTFLTMFLALCLSVSLFANQNETTNTDGKMGAGFNLSNQFALSSGDLDMSLISGSKPFVVFSAINNNIKTDLEFMYFRRSISQDEISRSQNLYLIHLGIFHVNALNSNFNLYYGARLGLFIISAKSEVGDFGSEDETDLISYTIAPTLGGEYFLNEYFSLFGEIALNINILDDDSDATAYSIGTYVGYGMKWYFK